MLSVETSFSRGQFTAQYYIAALHNSHEFVPCFLGKYCSHQQLQSMPREMCWLILMPRDVWISFPFSLSPQLPIVSLNVNKWHSPPVDTKRLAEKFSSFLQLPVKVSFLTQTGWETVWDFVNYLTGAGCGGDCFGILRKIFWKWVLYRSANHSGRWLTNGAIISFLYGEPS